MIADFSSIILAYSKEYTKSTINRFEYNGITYDDIPVSSTIQGIMTPIDDTDVEKLSELGYSITGQQTFFVPGTEALLTEDDIITDSAGTEWVILPKDKDTKNGKGIEDWREHGNFVKYIVSRRIL